MDPQKSGRGSSFPNCCLIPLPIREQTLSIRPPTLDQVLRIADSYGFDLSESELEVFLAASGPLLASCARLDGFEDAPLTTRYHRDAGWAPEDTDNPYNAWAWRCSVKGAPGGKLSGHLIALKDNICLAGMPAHNGSRVLDGFVPCEDATVVSRVLDAGAEIIGKAASEAFGFSAGSHTGENGPVHNPARRGYSTGGSSSGCGALLASGAVHMALGTDQGGSIRIPASWCGVVGLKPTYGLVPYTGIFGIENSLDHVGPMARNVGDVALLLQVIAGCDGLDPRQPILRSERYADSLCGDMKGLRIAILEEGFKWPGVSEPAVDESVTQAGQSMRSLGATVSSVSVPLHRDGTHIAYAVYLEGATAQMFAGDGQGWNWSGYYSIAMRDAFGRARRARANDFPNTVKFVALMGQYVSDRYNGHYYAKAQNLRRSLRAAYDQAFRDADVLVLPTTPMVAQPVPSGPGLEAYFGAAFGSSANAVPFNLTGHPAISMPCGTLNGLPIGMTLVGRHFEEPTLLRAAHAFEQASS
jgi:amidase